MDRRQFQEKTKMASVTNISDRKELKGSGSPLLMRDTITSQELRDHCQERGIIKERPVLGMSRSRRHRRVEEMERGDHVYNGTENVLSKA